MTSIDGDKPRRLLPDETNALFVPLPGGGSDGRLLFVRDDAVVAQPFNAERAVFTGDAIRIAERAGVSSNSHFYSFSASAGGALAYMRDDALFSSRQLAWIRRDGTVIETLGEPAAMFGLALSPDARRAAFTWPRSIIGSRLPDIWLMELGRKTLTRFTTEPTGEGNSVWSPDGSVLAFSMGIDHFRAHVYRKSTSGSGGAEPVLAIDGSTPPAYPVDWSPDGRWILVSRGGKGSRDLWAYSSAGDEDPFAYLATEFEEDAGQFSPDGKWVAYNSNKSGRWDVYLRPFPAADREWKVTPQGGQDPRWRGDGRELYFIAPEGNLMAVSLRTGESVEVGEAEALFQFSRDDNGLGGYYDVTSDGQRFLALMPLQQGPNRSITVSTNWLAKLEP